MHCILAEKPSVARELAHVLGSATKHEGYLTVGSNWVITWGFGHLVTLADPEHYNPLWKTWRLEQLPMLPEGFDLVPIAKTVSQWKIVRRWLTDPSVEDVICATDADREGELIFRYCYRLSGSTKPVRRLWLSETTTSAMQTGFKTMKPGSAYAALGDAAEARAQADWLVGLNATRVFTLCYGRGGQGVLSVGRVQTPTLQLIAERDRAIAAFRPEPYWQVGVTFNAPPGHYVARWTSQTDEAMDRLPLQTTAEELAAKVPRGTPGVITNLDVKRVTVHPPKLFSLNELQKFCHRQLGLTAQQTLDSAQRLYEARLTSYPRTDAQFLSQSVAESLPKRISLLSNPYGTLVHALPSPLITKALVNEAKVAAAGHHAIIPTGESGARLHGTDAAVYDLIVRRFFAALLPAGQDARTTVTTEAAGERFVSRGTTVVRPGWRVALEVAKDPDAADGEEPPVLIPAGLKVGMAVISEGAEVLSKQTKAPPALNDASILTLMEKYGLGTPATRARIVEVLLSRGYVIRKKKNVVSTDKGQALLQVVLPDLKSPDLTGKWEAQLENIVSGHERAADFLAAIRDYTDHLITAVRSETAESHGAGTVALAEKSSAAFSEWGRCPLCAQGDVIQSKKGWQCSRWKEGCSLMIWSTVAKKKLTTAQVRQLLAGKPTRVIRGFESKAGKKFAARLILESGKVTFQFESQSSSTGSIDGSVKAKAARKKRSR